MSDVNRYCANCGDKASINFDKDLKSTYILLEEKLNLVNKKRIAIRGDRHCLLRAVFRGCKSKDILAQYFTYKALLSLLLHQFKRPGVTITMLSPRIKSPL